MSASLDQIIQDITGKTDLEINIDKIGNALVMRDDRLSDWERDFINSICDKFSQFGKSAKFSEKQISIINRIADKVSDIPAI